MKMYRHKNHLALVMIFYASAVVAQVDSIKGVPVEFEFQHTLTSGETGVGLEGTFNDWGVYYNRHPYQMVDVGGNLWKITVPLLPDTARTYKYKGLGFYEYKFVTYNITGNDTSIVGWFPDPNNSRSDPSDNNNSILYVTDPIVYGLQPLNGSVLNNKSPIISAKLSAAKESKIDISSIKLEINGTVISGGQSYYDSLTHRFTYPVQTPLSEGTYTIKLSVKNDRGYAGADSSTFTIANAIVNGPYTFIFDPYSPNLDYIGDSILTVSVSGQFNNYGADAMSGPDTDGLYRITEMLPIGKKSSYNFIVRNTRNITAYLSDPLNPLLGNDYSPYVVKQVQLFPIIEPIYPHQGTILPGDSTGLAAIITSNDSGTVIDTNSIHVYFDNVEIKHWVDSVANGYEIHAWLTGLSAGRHIVQFTGADVNGIKARDAFLTFGVYAANSGYHYVDGQNDDDGPGGYIYPAGIPPHSADIYDINISTNSAGDSLEFTINMGAVSDYTRLALEITNSLNGEYVDPPEAIKIKIPDWNNRGVYMIIAAPNSTKLDGMENFLFTSRSSLQNKLAISVNPDAKTTGQFRFAIPFSALESIMGTFTSRWYFSAYSYFANSSGPIKVGLLQGGTLGGENPYIYDAAFFYNTEIQHRYLSNYITSSNTGGPRFVTIATARRGVDGITPSEISPLLASRPIIYFLTDGGDWYQDTVRVYGRISDSTVTMVSISLVNGGITHDTTVTVAGGIFSALLHLTDGQNLISASVNKSGTIVSKAVVFTYHADHSTRILIKYTISGRNVTLDAGASSNPDQLPITYKWQPDPANPAAVNLSATNSPITSYVSPAKDGEYYFNLTAITSLDTSWARAVVVVDSGLPHTVNLDEWHPAWVDSAVVYEIYVRSFSSNGKLSSITAKIPQLKALGVNCIWLMPVMPATSPHGYNVTDYYGINADYGTKADFANLVNTAHSYGIKVMMDLVINHTSLMHPFMRDAYKYNQYSPYYSFYEWDSKGNYEFLFGWWDLPNINYESAWVRDYLLRMVNYWVEKFNIDGYRCDVAWAVNDMRPSGPMFWQSFRSQLKGIKPDVYLLAEADATGLQYFDKKFDSGYDWSLFNRLKTTLSHSTTVSSLDSLVAWYEKPAYPSYVRPFRFMENHDETRFINLFNVQQTKMAAAFLFTIPGVPLIYSGQEVGETAQRDIINWSDPYNLQPYYTKLVHIRTANPALQQGSFIRLKTSSGDSVYAYLRIAGDNSALVVNNFYSNATRTAISIPVDTLHLDPVKSWYANDFLNGTSQTVTPSSLSSYTVNLTPYQSQVIIFGNSPLTEISRKSVRPLTYALQQNYPNPFNPSTTISYEIPTTEKVTLKIYDVLGRTVATLVDDVLQPGQYTAVWSGENSAGIRVATGVYFYRLQAGSFTSVRKMLLVK
ncbi:MAG: alpha-amylase family glycosyl hydrolase [Candidatus Kryptoniota bacterium]